MAGKLPREHNTNRGRFAAWRVVGNLAVQIAACGLLLAPLWFGSIAVSAEPAAGEPAEVITSPSDKPNPEVGAAEPQSAVAAADAGQPCLVAGNGTAKVACRAPARRLRLGCRPQRRVCSP